MAAIRDSLNSSGMSRKIIVLSLFIVTELVYWFRFLGIKIM